MKMMKTKLKCVLTIILITLFLCSCSVQTPDDYFSSSDIENGIKVSVSIDCSVILDNLDKLDDELKDFVPDDGTILPPAQVVVNKDASVYDALREACRQNKIHLEHTGSDTDIYIEGIANIYEFSCGPLSGWQYKVNGEFYPLGCNNVNLNEGDTVEFIYTCDLGKDIGNSFTG